MVFLTKERTISDSDDGGDLDDYTVPVNSLIVNISSKRELPELPAKAAEHKNALGRRSLPQQPIPRQGLSSASSSVASAVSSAAAAVYANFTSVSNSATEKLKSSAPKSRRL